MVTNRAVSACGKNQWYAEEYVDIELLMMYHTLCMLNDNLSLQEWAEGYEIRFGLYEWNPDGSQKRTFRGDYAEAVKTFSNMTERMAIAREAAK